MLDKIPKSKILPGLYVVATPIGNLRDITLRALDVLEAADILLCEDTRVTGKLMNAYGLHQTLLAYHDHNADKMRPRIMEALDAGQVVAQVSDAGTPLVSDPGFKLVQDCVAAGHKVYPIPGASAPLAALAGAGLPSDRFLFIGFLPNKKKGRVDYLTQESQLGATLICFESPKRITATLADIAEIWPSRQLVVARELTKMFEEFKRDTAENLAEYYAANPTPKGEIVLLLAPLEKNTEAVDIDTLLKEAMVENSLRDAAAIVAEATGRPRKEVYKLALSLKD